jgi:hypothetical protein
MASLVRVTGDLAVSENVVLAIAVCNFTKEAWP